MVPRADIASWVWESKYRRSDVSGRRDRSIEDSWRRVATAVAAAEQHGQQQWADAFFSAMRELRFLPGGRIIAGAGTGDEVTLFNCFVMPPQEDGRENVERAIREAAVTMQAGGGIGFDLSLLSPRTNREASATAGPVARLHTLDAMCEELLANNARRGAMMATLRCDHPDIRAFIDAKRQAGALRNFNLSVQVTDAFMAAVRSGGPWQLVFPAGERGSAGNDILVRQRTGTPAPIPCRVHAEVAARDLWSDMLRAAYDSAEPGMLFIDRINALNNLWYSERITATNPCGEVPLPPYGACDLGSLNLVRFVRNGFTARAALDEDALSQTAAVAVRLLDDVIDVARFPLPQQREVARSTRRIGLGITGLADALVLLGLRYSSAEARQWTSRTMALLCHAAYRSSIALAEEKGAFPAFDRDRYLEGRFIARLPPDIREGIASHGIRNSHLLAIAPTGSISLLAGCVSSGLEPIFAPSYRRTVTRPNGTTSDFEISSQAVALWRRLAPKGAELPPAFESAAEITIKAQLAMQAVLQPHVDNAISKTVTVAADVPFSEFAKVFNGAHDLGLKGCTAYRAGTVRGAVLDAREPACQAVPC